MVSFITIVFAFLLGLLAWRLQLIGKRQTEIAEETLLAFNLAIDSIASLRSPIAWSNEQEAVRKNAGFSVDQQMGGESFRITLLRFEKQKEKFDSLRARPKSC